MAVMMMVRVGGGGPVDGELHDAVQSAMLNPSTTSMMQLLTLSSKHLFGGVTRMDDITVPVVRFDPATNLITKMTEPALKIFDFQEEDVIGKMELSALARIPKHAGNGIRVVNCRTSHGHDVVVEFKLVGSNMAILRDVSFAASLQQLHSLREERAVLADYIGIPIISINQKSLITEFNRRAGELFGYPPGLVMGQNVSMLMTPDIGAHHHSFVMGQRRSAFGPSRVLGITRDVLCRHRDGGTFCTKMLVRTLSSANPCSPLGGVLSSPRGGGSYTAYFVGAAITTSAANFNILPKSAAHILNVLKQINPSVGFIVMNDMGTVLEMSGACEELTGWSRSEIVGNPITDVLIPENIARHHQTHVDRYCRKSMGAVSKVVGQHRFVPVRHKDGTDVVLDLVVVDMDVARVVSTGGQRLFLGVFAPAPEGTVLPETEEGGKAEGVTGSGTPLTSPKSTRFDRFVPIE
jgi:PAS domain S-box-containing protein